MAGHRLGTLASKGQVWTRHLAPAAPAFHSLNCLSSSILMLGACPKFEPMCCSLTSLNGARALEGINGQAAMSALGSGCACPTAFIAHCSRWRVQRIQVHWRVPARSLPQWLGCERRFRRTFRSAVTPSPGPLFAGSHSALPAPAPGRGGGGMHEGPCFQLPNRAIGWVTIRSMRLRVPCVCTALCMPRLVCAPPSVCMILPPPLPPNPPHLPPTPLGRASPVVCPTGPQD